MIYYLLGDKQDRSTWRVEARNHVARHSLGEVPIDPLTGLPEDIAWLQIESVQQPDDSFRDEITVDAALKAQIQAQRDAADLQRSSDDADREVERQARRDDLASLRPNDLKDLKDIKQSIRAIWRYLKERDGL